MLTWERSRPLPRIDAGVRRRIGRQWHRAGGGASGRAPSAPRRISHDTDDADARLPADASSDAIKMTDCALVLRNAQRTWALPIADIKTLRRREVRPDARANGVMVEIANQCDELACVPAAVGLLGIGAAIQGLDNLAHPPKVVYRARRALVARRAAAVRGGGRSEVPSAL